jgi:hypothetical protein
MFNGPSNYGSSMASTTVTGVEKAGWTSPGAYLFPVVVWKWRK